MVAGYVVMRVPWSSSGCAPPARTRPARRAASRYIVTILVAQAGWVALLVADTSVTATFAWAGCWSLLEFAGPVIAEPRKGGTPGTRTTSPSATACS